MKQCRRESERSVSRKREERREVRTGERQNNENLE
jgi:hypothetical protein